MTSTLIQGGELVDPLNGVHGTADLLFVRQRDDLTPCHNGAHATVATHKRVDSKFDSMRRRRTRASQFNSTVEDSA